MHASIHAPSLLAGKLMCVSLCHLRFEKKKKYNFRLLTRQKRPSFFFAFSLAKNEFCRALALHYVLKECISSHFSMKNYWHKLSTFLGYGDVCTTCLYSYSWKIASEKMYICLYMVIETFSFFTKVIMPRLLHLLDNIKLRVFYIRDATQMQSYSMRSICLSGYRQSENHEF